MQYRDVKESFRTTFGFGVRWIVQRRAASDKQGWQRRDDVRFRSTLYSSRQLRQLCTRDHVLK